MKSMSWMLPFLVTALLAGSAHLNADDTEPRTDENKSTDAENRQQELERDFKEALTGVVLRGTFQMTNADGLKGKAPLTPPRPERYAIQSVSKSVGDNWVITAKVTYADRDAIVPVAVRVVWAGDTPVITLDKMSIPLLGTYSARVVVHDGFYGGTWSGIGYGGVLAGQIIKAEDEAMIKKMEAEGFEMTMPGETPKRQDAKTPKQEEEAAGNTQAPDNPKSNPDRRSGQNPKSPR